MPDLSTVLQIDQGAPLPPGTPPTPAAAGAAPPRTGPASIQLPPVAGSVPVGNGEYAVGQGAAPIADQDKNVIDVHVGAPAAAAPAYSPADFGGDAALAAKMSAAEDPNWKAGEAPAPAKPGTRTGYLPNIAAGVIEGASGLANVMADPFGNLVGKPLATIGMAVHDLLAPVFGYQPLPDDFRKFIQEDQAPQIGTRAANFVGRAIGAPPLESIQPAGPGEAFARSAAAGAMAGGPIAGVGGALAGGMGAMTGYAAGQAAPERYSDAANLLGNFVGGGLSAAGQAALEAGLKLPAGAYKTMRQPMNLGADQPLVDPTTGQPFLHTETGAPITARAGQQQLAGTQIAGAARQSPDQVAASLPAPGAATPVPGSQGSMGQILGNLGLLNFERSLRQSNKGAFTEAEAKNSVARTNALRGLADPAASGQAARQFFAERLARLRALGDALERSAAESGQRIADTLGAAPDSTGHQELGATQRAALEAIRDPIKKALRRLYDAVEGDGKLALGVQAVKEAARALKAELDPLAGDAFGPEGALVEAARNLPDVVLFSTLRKLDSNLGDVQRAVRNDPKLGAESPPMRRLTMLRTAIDQAMIEAVGDDATEEAAAAKGGSGKPTVGERLADEEQSAPNAGNSVFTPTGREVGVRYRLAEAGDLIASHDDDLKVNPAYPPELQPRDRTRAASQAQVQRIAGNLNPDLLGASPTGDTGAPIVGPDHIVEGGNARVLGVRRAYAQGGKQAAAYRAWLESQGYKTEGMKAPILVRERTTDLAPADRVRFAEELNAPAGLGVSAAEQARVDARRLGDSTLGLYRGGDVDLAQNAPFVRAFVRDVLDPGQEGALADKDGQLSSAGAQRIRNALVQHAYGDEALTRALAETDGENLRAFGGALMDAAGDMARLRADIAAGRVDPEMGLGPQLAEAANVVAQARRAGVTVAEQLAQSDALNPVSTIGEAILRAAYGDNPKGRLNRAEFAAILSDYARLAGEQSTAPRLIGENLTRAQALAEAEARNAATKGRGAAGANVPAGGVGAGPGNRTVGAAPQQPGNGAPGPGNTEQAQAPAAVQVGRNNAAVAPQLRIVEPQLEPNFTPEARARLRAANAAYREYKDTFRRGAVGDVLRSQTGPTGFALGEDRVPAKLFRADDKGGAVAADDLIRAAGSPEKALEVLGDYPAWAFRRSAEENGVINQAKAAKWIAANRATLDKFPGLREKFADAGSATAEVMRASKAGQDAIKAYQKTAAQHFLPRGNEVEPPEPIAAIERLVKSPTAAGDAAEIMRQAAPDQAATDGIKRAFIDFLMAKLTGTAEAGVAGEKEIAGGMFQRWFQDPQNAGVARAILGPDGADTLAKIGKDIEQGARAFNATKIPGSAASASDFLGALRQGVHNLGVPGQMAALEMAIAFGEHFMGGSGIAAAAAAPMLLLNGMRMVGLRDTADLAAQGLLQPELGRLLLSKVPLKEGSAALNTLLGRIAAVGVSASTAKGGK